MSFIPMKYHCF